MPNDPLETLLADLQNKYDVASGGDWAVDDHIINKGDTPDQWHVFDYWPDDPPLLSTCFGTEEDCQFVAAARNSLPKLLKIIRRQNEALKDFKAFGLRCDTNPTNTHTWDVIRWYEYIKSADSHCRDRAEQALSDCQAIADE